MTDESRKVLLAGSSGMTFSTTGAEDSLVALLAAALNRQAPSYTWLVEGRQIRPRDDISSRLASAVAEVRPDVVVFGPACSYFTYDYVIVRLRRFSPALYRRAISWSARLRRLAGGGIEGAESPRGWLFRVPRALAAKLLGVAPYMPVDEAVASAGEAVHYLARQETIVTVGKVPSMAGRFDPKRMALYTRRLQEFQRAFESICEKHRVPWYGRERAAEELGVRLERGEDGHHLTLESRRWEADYTASVILKALHLDRVEAGTNPAAQG